jgi:hypothetical protein
MTNQIFYIFTFLFAIGYSFAMEPQSRRNFSSPPEEIEVNIIRVEFPIESPNNSLTTSDGTFDTDTSGSELDVSGERGLNPYWQSQIARANQWFKSVSQSKISLSTQVWPKSSDTQRASYKMPKEAILYARTQKLNDEKLAEFDSSKAVDLMQFVRDAVNSAAQDSSGPFFQKSTHKKRIFLIARPGSSRITDGGTGGAKQADTPGDLIDFFASKSDFIYLKDIDSAQTDTLGIVLNTPMIDTLDQVLISAETYSQDSLTWGITGNIVQQICQSIGLPLTYDIAQGLPRLGSFDIMDFTGAFAGAGYLPTMPMAWHRSYLGWDQVEIAKAEKGKSEATYTLWPAHDTDPSHLRILKIPLPDGTELLLENRQRNLDSSKLLVVTNTEKKSFSYKYDSLFMMFSDSLCKDKNCNLNKDKAKGIISQISEPDVALPGSGVAVWRVNKTRIEETLHQGFINSWQNDYSRDSYPSLQLLEADGDYTLGKEFSNSSGGKVVDQGSGSDLWPHIRQNKISKIKDTIQTLKISEIPGGIFTSGGNRNIEIHFSSPNNARLEKGTHSLSGDSVFNFGTSPITLTIYWGDKHIIDANYPSITSASTNSQVSSIIPLELGWASVGGQGEFELFNHLGKALTQTSNQTLNLQPDFILAKELIADTSLQDFVQTPLHTIQASPSDGKFIDFAVQKSTAYLLHKNTLRVLSWATDTFEPITQNVKIKDAIIGPIVGQDGVWWLNNDSAYRYSKSEITSYNHYSEEPLSMALHSIKVEDKMIDQIVWIDKGSKVFTLDSLGTSEVKWQRNLDSHWKELLNKRSQTFRVAISDFNRNDAPNLYLLGSQGFSAFINLDNDELETGSPRIFPRGHDGLDSYGNFIHFDNAWPSIADLNEDGYPEVVFTGYNSVWAINFNNSPISGFPFQFYKSPLEGHLRDSKYQPGLLNRSTVIANLDGRDSPEILVSSPSGTIWAINNQAKRFADHWPLAAGDQVKHSVHPRMDLSVVQNTEGKTLLGARSHHTLEAWNLNKAILGPNSWQNSQGSPLKRSFFDATKLTEGLLTPQDIIKDFHLFPSPIRNAKATLHIEIGANASSSTIEVYDINGKIRIKQELGKLNQGNNQQNLENLQELGADVYAAKLVLEFESGKKKTKWFKFGVLR